MKKSVALTTIIALHAAVIGILLIQAGCNSSEEVKNEATSSTEEVTTISNNDTSIVEPSETKIKEGDPTLRANPTIPTTPLADNDTTINNSIINPPTDTDVVVKPIEPTKKIVEPIEKDAKTITYVVKKGDSLSKIASKHNVKVAKIIELNSLKNANSIYIGQKLKIQAGETNPAIDAAQKQDIQPTSVGEDLSIYIVKKGDSLSKIAYRNGMSVAQLMQVNNLKNANIRIGQKLNVIKSSANQSAEKTSAKNATKNTPVAKDGEVAHVVKSGEFLGLIATKYSVKISAIKKRNNISDPRKLRAGQTIIIPVSNKSQAVKTETKVEQPKVEQPKVEQPKVEQPKV
ncbi:MAG: LysM peptidoglycan-binding domain-containing protein, partial [Opitutales bacterium]|nr:LysM peptidoglycan-binding domain-containing protein [Opitutales bacterium]